MQRRWQRMPSGSMRVSAGMRTNCVVVFLAILVAGGAGCSLPKRPENVSVDAVRIPGIKGTDFWQQCSLQQTTHVVRCQIFNGVGHVLREDVFVPYIGSLPSEQRDLKIVPRGGNEWVELENGTILIPESQFARIKDFLDWERGLKRRP